MRMLLPAVLAAVLIAGGPALGDPLGDFDGNMHVDHLDIDLIADAIRLGWTDPMYDLTADGLTAGQDGVIDIFDQQFLIRYLVETMVGTGTEYGDFNLSGEIDATDLTRLAGSFGGPYSTWNAGNANRHIDLVVDITDLTILATYWPIIGPFPDAIPEPVTLSLLAIGGAALLRHRRARP